MEKGSNSAETLVLVTEPDESREYEEPQGEIERMIARLWSEAFRLEKVGRNDNFFELGGNSALGMRLTEAIGRGLTVQIPVVALFQNPTVRELAQLISPGGPS